MAGRPGVVPSAPGAGEGAECVAHRSARFPRGRGAGRTGHRDLREVRLRPLRPRGAGRPPRWGACCSHVGLGGVGSRTGAGWSQEAAALRTPLETGRSCGRLPRDVARCPQRCAVQPPSARGAWAGTPARAPPSPAARGDGPGAVCFTSPQEAPGEPAAPPDAAAEPRCGLGQGPALDVTPTRARPPVPDHACPAQTPPPAGHARARGPLGQPPAAQSLWSAVFGVGDGAGGRQREWVWRHRPRDEVRAWGRPSRWHVERV